MKIARKYVLTGRVQGVGFRFFALHAAKELGISGYVTNKWDDTVEAYAIGEPAQLEEFKRRLAEGPRSARVENIVESNEEIDKRYKRFVIE
jgi:acylphosphatase